ncbi:hypothetical protein [Streptomyces sp. NPDC054863]
MGIDIDGAMESGEGDGVWEVEIDLLDFELGRAREPWDVLFGYSNNSDVKHPLFSARGLPHDASESVRETGNEDYQRNHTYVTWAEVAAAGRDAPISDGPAWNWVGEWRRTRPAGSSCTTCAGHPPSPTRGKGRSRGTGRSRHGNGRRGHRSFTVIPSTGLWCSPRGR